MFSMSHGPDDDFRPFDFVDDAVVSDAELPEPAERLSKPQAIVGRGRHQSLVNGPKQPFAKVLGELVEILKRHISDLNTIGHSVLFDLEVPFRLGQ